MPEDLPETIFESEVTDQLPKSYHETIRDAKRRLITKTLEQTGGNFTDAAKLLGIHPNNLHRLMRNLKLRDSD
jgi:transcriptional regulator with GAF, ATPase, and Fis domain